MVSFSRYHYGAGALLLSLLLLTVYLWPETRISPPPTEGKTVIVGAGAQGLMTAYYLAQKRPPADIIIVEQRAGPAEGCSWGNAGWITTGTLPINSPANIQKIWQRTDSPYKVFSIRPPASLEYWRWLLNFLLSSTPSEYEHSRQTVLNAQAISRQLHQELAHQIQPPALKTEGSLTLYKDAHTFEQAQHSLSEKANAGVVFSILNAEQAQSIEPAVREDIHRAIHIQNDMQVSPGAYFSYLADWLKAQGVVFLFDTHVQDIEQKQHQVNALVTNHGRIEEVRQLVIAAGVESVELARKLGAPIPQIESAEGYHIDVPAPNTSLRTAVSLAEPHIIVSSMQTPSGQRFVRLTGLLGLHGKASVFDPDLLAALSQGVEQEYLQLPLDLQHPLNVWRGRRPLTPDSLPYISAVPGTNNAFINAGHGVIGVTLSAFSGKLMAQLMEEQRPLVDPTPFRYARFW